MGPEAIMNGQRNMCMTIEHIKFIDSISFLPFPLRKLASAFGLSASKAWYPHYFNTEENLNYNGPISDVSYYGVNEMGDAERIEFLEWYEGQKIAEFNNKRVLELYCQDDVTVLCQASQVFRREFMETETTTCFWNPLRLRQPATRCCENVS
jgi:DNA polymerase type B, organellar and viral.